MPDSPTPPKGRSSWPTWISASLTVTLGFGEPRDLDNLQRVREAAGHDCAVMVDANQAWDLATAIDRMQALRRHDLGWIEEPLRADRPWTEWQALRAHAPAPLPAGENVAGGEAFDALIASGAVHVVQPDVAKWGGISGTLEVVRRVQAAGLRHCPHCLGAGVGLLHSAHLLAATGGGGWLEVDANDNPLRMLLCGGLNEVHEGRARLGRTAGIGIEPDLRLLREASAC
jgi:D-galactarolactone cycloisomerase